MDAKKRRISLAADHGGFKLKEGLKKYLLKKGYKVLDFGTDSPAPCDYPVFGYEAAKAVRDKKAEFGIVICKSGFGMAIVANKVKGIRSAVCDSAAEAESARLHNDVNVMSLSANRTKLPLAKKIVDTFLSLPFEGGRHKRRISQIQKIERGK